MLWYREYRVLKRLCALEKHNILRLSSTTSCNNVNALNGEIKTGGVVPVFKLASIYTDKLAVQDTYGNYTYRDLFITARRLSTQISNKLHGQTQKTITYLCPGDSLHIITQWAIWMSGNIAVPLSPQHPKPLLEYFLKDCGSSLTICDENLFKNLPNEVSNVSPTIVLPSTFRTPVSQESNDESLDIKAIDLSDLPNGNFYAKSDGLIIYTSGTTSKPKGVLYSFKQIAVQIASLHLAWCYKSTDVMLHTLPLHHVHGLINSVSASLAAGATLRMLPNFDAANVWSHLLGMNKDDIKKVTVFMGVPTMYSKLIEEYEKVFANGRQKNYIKNYLSIKMRLMISGSSSLPVPVFERWEEISGHRLLERYGMTEIGMALSNLYEPMSDRTPGSVGTTLPGVKIKIVSNEMKTLITLETPAPKLEIDLERYNFHPHSEIPNKNLFISNIDDCDTLKKCEVTYNENEKGKGEITGELLAKGPSVFQKYWNRPEQTKAEFTADGWFKTGDTALYENGKVRLLGRTSVDIIKSGGYKISALEIETIILGHQAIADAAVLGLPDITWGEKIVAVIELKPDMKLKLKELQDWALQFAPHYQLPSELHFVTKLPRNLMGKVNKKELKQVLMKKQ